MKKSIVALAVLGSFASVAAAQSSVTLFGVADAAARYNKAAGKTVKSLISGGNTTSRLGVRGTEDLGGGLKVSFWLEGQVDYDQGTAAAAFWGRRSTISLTGEFGEVRVGRFKSAARLHIEDFDPASTTGLGDITKVYSALGSGVDLSRFSNQVTYILPSNLGGFYGVGEVAAGEGVDSGKQFGGRAGYKAGPLHVSVALSNAGATKKYKVTSVGGSYDLSVAKLNALYTTNKFGTAEQKILTLAATAPVGAGLVWGSWTKSDANTAAEAISGVGDATLLAGGYIYNLSKRTALYTTVSKIENKGKARFSLANSPAVANGGGSGGFDVGIRHSF
ncbi:porin [Paucibacter sp. DJ1R-11]|uniref:porin n=1 Tax=Paucibacter sp. DJ1R-11 TaxID=2893556 RepID=UPI0021E35BE3|nr:porin [Paucibacter sp. DJ1R-11]MCV2365447.1 porin [Paucibacter sp. DJ1R-11]